MTATSDAVADAYRREWASVLAATVRAAGDIDLAEEWVQEAFTKALVDWDANGVPDRPGAWLTTTAKRKALDQLRRASTLRRKLPLLVEPKTSADSAEREETSVIADDRLRLMFTCCHPALATETQVALTLRLVCGLPTGDIASAFLVSDSTMAARITRGKKKIQSARIPFTMPRADDLRERLDAVLTVIHLFFTAGHTASSGDTLVNREVTVRSIELGRLLSSLVPGDPEVDGLLALMLLTDARRDARIDSAGDLVLLDQQDRSTWDSAQLIEGVSLAAASLQRPGPPGRFALQAAIARVHAAAQTAAATDWHEIVYLYDELLVVWPSPVVALNRAVAVSRAVGPEEALAAVELLSDNPLLAKYLYLWSTRADLLRQLGRYEEAAQDYRQALTLVENGAERQFLQGRLTMVRRS
ncbi:MAG: sigma-70 family RNA polymerase sigma factor [Actinomycetes bacterium]